MKKYFGDWKFNKKVLLFSFPVVVQGFITSCINFVDSLMMGLLADTAVGAVAAANRFFMILIYAVSGMSGTAGVYISQFFGAQRKREIRQSFYGGIMVTFGMLIPFFILAGLWPHKIIGFFSSDPDIIAVGTGYVRIVKYSFIPLCLSLCISSALQAVGLIRIPLYVSGISVIVKILCNYVLMFGNLSFPELGVIGAAYSTVISRVIELAMYVYAAIEARPDFLNGLAGFFDIPLSLIKNIIITAIPFSVNNIAWGAGNSMILKIYGSLGTVSYNAYVILTTVNDIFETIHSSYGNANSILIAQQIGRNDPERSRRYVDKIHGLGFVVGMALCFGIFAIQYLIPLIYAKLPLNEINIARNLTVLKALTFIVYEMSMMNYFTFKAGGDTRSIAIMDSAMSWLVQIPILYVFANYLNVSVYAVFLGSQIAEVLKLFVSTWLKKKEHWLNNLAVKNVIENV